MDLAGFGLNPAEEPLSSTVDERRGDPAGKMIRIKPTSCGAFVFVGHHELH